VSLVLGTNIFCSDGLSAILKPAAQPGPGATIFGQQVGNLKDMARSSCRTPTLNFDPERRPIDPGGGSPRGR
jgi:hypothetical protein